MRDRAVLLSAVAVSAAAAWSRAEACAPDRARAVAARAHARAPPGTDPGLDALGRVALHQPRRGAVRLSALRVLQPLRGHQGHPLRAPRPARDRVAAAGSLRDLDRTARGGGGPRRLRGPEALGRGF